MRTIVPALGLAVMLACDAGETPTCASLAVEYRAARDGAMVCDPRGAAPCIAHGATVSVLVTDGGREVVDGLCTSCPAGVNRDRTAELDAILARYSARGCAGICPCPTARLDPGWTPECTPTADGGGACEP